MDTFYALRAFPFYVFEKSFYEFIVPWFTFKTCSNSITGNRIDMKLELQTQIEKRRKNNAK